LTDADGVAKVAIVSLLLGVGAEEAKTRLESAGGILRRALA
jgi:N-acetylmuramic acid 6-phosphate (MurNAc-6-P) etherase